MNTYHVLLEGPDVLSDGVFITNVDLKLTDMYELIDTLVSTAHEYTEITYFNVTQDRPMASGAIAGSADGTDATDLLPPQVSFMINWGTTVARSQGRKFLAGFTVAGQDSLGAPITGLMTVGAQFVAEALDTWEVGAFNLQFGNYRPLDGRFAEWVSGLANAEFKTQRRRYVSAGV
jgi:hypothetical protein